MANRAILALLLVLASCTLDREETVRAELAQWLWPGEMLEFTSRATCTAAVFALATPGLRPNAPVVQSVQAGLTELQAGRIVVFAVPGQGPHLISEAIMSSDLGLGLGLLSNGVGPAQRCLPAVFGPAYYDALRDPDAVMVVDVAGNSVSVVRMNAGLVFFMRGKV